MSQERRAAQKKRRQADRLPGKEQAEIETAGAVMEPGEKARRGLMKIDLHCHSEASPDCVTPIGLIPARCADQEIRIQAITDHNVIWGAHKIMESIEKQNSGETDVRIIIGEEISTNEGELIGLFLEEPVEAGLSPEETVERIKSQGGLVLLPHGFDPLKRRRLRPEARERIAGSIDIVETFNARISRRRWNKAAVEWSEDHGVLMSAGSDAHTLDDIGSAWVEVPLLSIESSQDMLAALDGGVPAGKWTHPVIAYLYKLWYQIRQLF